MDMKITSRVRKENANTTFLSHTLFPSIFFQAVLSLMIISFFSFFVFSVNKNRKILGWVQWQLSDRTRFASLLGLQIPWGDASEAWICRMIWLKITCKKNLSESIRHWNEPTFFSNKCHIFKKNHLLQETRQEDVLGHSNSMFLSDLSRLSDS